MNIDRHNYEEYFILYLDNELTNVERRSVELFAAAHPDLQEELNILLQSKLIPDESYTFIDKALLFKSASTSINATNYEEWMLSAVDDELTSAQQTELEQFLSDHPQYKQQLDALMRVKLQPEHIHFPDKALLYREEEIKTRVIAFNWKKYAAAAAILLSVGTATFYVLQLNKKIDNTVAVVTTPAAKEMVKELSPVTQNTFDSSTDQIVEEVIPTTISKANVKSTDAVAVSATSIETPSVVIDKPADNAIAKTETIEQTSLTNTNTELIAANVTSENASAFIPTEEDIDTDPLPSEPGKQKKLRGIFRKITRTFEKNTNIKATDDEDRLLLGGLAIRL